MLSLGLTLSQTCVIFILIVFSNNNPVGGDSVEKSDQLSLHQACQAELRRICGKKPENLADLDALECILDTHRNEADELSDECNHQLWLYRKQITESKGFLDLATKECQDDFRQQAKICWEKDVRDNNLVNCIVDKKDMLTKERCRTFITRLEGVIFSDFELMGRFANVCSSDIAKLHCGRNEVVGGNTKPMLPHSQGKTIECLSSSENLQQLNKLCAVELLRVAELQVEDFHLDRALYFACRDDREKFCPRVKAGLGRVYKCLVKHKMEMEMSHDCREQIYRRQRLGWQDYRASGIVAQCKTEIKRLKCRRDASSTTDKTVRLSQILLCLETAAHKGQQINGDCVEEMKLHRRGLMEDFRITPELLSACVSEHQNYCAVKGVNTNTIHCLMALAQSRNMGERISPKCRAGLEDLVKISDVSSDWRVDPILQQKCLPVVDRSSCSSLPPDRVLDCLMNLLTSDNSQGTDANAMNEECEITLLQIQYFISRVFPVDNSLYEVCRDDAESVCGVKEWEADPSKYEPNNGPLILSCLFRNIGTDGTTVQISRPCAEKVRETMRRRAISVRLMPEIEEPCLTSLADLCHDKTKPGEELGCLQDHLNDLSRECKIAVSNYTEIEMKNPTTNPYLYKYCRDLIDTKCSDDRSDDSDLLECLIELKPEMKSKKCRATVEHLQILRVKDFNFTPKFKSQCHEFVVRNCKTDKPMTAGGLVACLSEIIRNDTLTDRTPRITKGCRKQVRNLILSKLQLENGQLDPASIYGVCRDSITKLCSKVTRGQGRILNCLGQHKQYLMETDQKCYGALFKVQQDVNNDATLDIQLQRDCFSEINMFCNGRSDDLVSCLLKASNEKKGFNENVCGRTLRQRQIEQNSDARLNPRLRKACKYDIPKFCKEVSAGEGNITTCLKKRFSSSESQNRLTSSCRDHMAAMMEGAAQKDIRIDSVLYISCKEDIDSSCRETQDNDANNGDGGKTEECLKNLFHDNKLKFHSCKDQVKQLIQSTLVDIHVDPMLNQACAIDLVKRCDNVPPGDGRLIGCLLAVLEEDNVQKVSRLSEQCHDLLSLRSELFQLAGSSKIDSIQDLYNGVQKSPHKNYFLTVGMTIVGLIFIFGLFCGRATKRKIEFKDK